MTHFRAFLLAAAACLLPTLGLADTVTLNPTADAYVQNGNNANRNYGTNTQLRAQTNTSAASNYDSYLKFDTATATGTVTSAKLRLFASLSKAGNVNSSVHGVANTSWGETTITWNNKPALGNELSKMNVASTSYAWKEIDVTAYVQAEKAAGRNLISLGLHNGATSSVYVRANSREATSNRPELVIVTATPNVPPTVSITSPAGGASFTAPASITLSANAADSDGSIASVAFYNGATLIGSGTLAGGSYTYTWSNVAAGSYSLSARTTDNQGASTDSAPVAVTVTDPPPPPVASGVYYVYADHLNTPRVITDGANKIVWRWDSDPFGADAANEDPDGDGQKFRYNLRFPGQYYDKETGLHYNYFRDYEPGTGRYVQSDPIGLAGGLNTYGYVRNNPIAYTDPLGLDINVCYYPDGITHVGSGVVGESGTFGFYPKKRWPIWRGTVLEDTKDKPRECKMIPSDSEQDRCMVNCRLRRTISPGWYHLTQRQCTSFVRDCMRECGIPTGIAPALDPWQGPRPVNFFRALPGIPVLHE